MWLEDTGLAREVESEILRIVYTEARKRRVLPRKGAALFNAARTRIFRGMISPQLPEVFRCLNRLTALEWDMQLKDIPNFENLTDLERLGLAEELIASVKKPDGLPAPVAHRIELERRWAEYERNPAAALSTEQFWAQVETLKT
jgi:putative addiction module component (TIGR02574 family)